MERRAGRAGGVAPGIVARTRLERLLAGAWERRVTLVVAGGGYGKTTALKRLADAPSARWLALTAGDREVEVLASHISAAAGAGSESVAIAPSAAIGALDRRALAEGLAGGVCASLDSLVEPLLVVIDDVDQVADADPASSFLSALCLQAPPGLRLVLGGRRLPSLGLGSARGKGELLELTAADLAFTPEETAALLVARLGARAEPLAADCWRLTGGWAAAVQLLADRLERVDAGQWAATLEQVQRHRGTVLSAFAADLVERESPPARRILAIASIVRSVDPELLAGLGVPSALEGLDGLLRRGLIVAAGERGASTVSPVLSHAVAGHLTTVEADELRRSATAWLEQAGRLDEALDCAAAGGGHDLVALLRRSGRRLVAAGHGARVAGLLRELGRGDDLELQTIHAEALVAAGDWDGAMQLFGDIERRAPQGRLEPAAVWRYGALLYLRGETEAARRLLSAALDQSARTSDAALISAWLSTTQWGRGEICDAARMAAVALAQADASGEPSARAAAHVAVALAAAAAGDREGNERHHRLGLAAARQAGDSIQLARIHNNLSSKAVEDGDYPCAIEEADRAIAAGSGHDMFSAMAISNKAEALMHTGELDEARALLVQAAETFDRLGSLAATPHILLGRLDSERGDLVRARVSLERALRIGERAGDVHDIALARCALARLLAQDDPPAARTHARQAAEVATSLELAPALCACALVELHAGDLEAAERLALEAQTQAQRTDDRPSLAWALGLRGSARRPPDEEQLASAADLWREVGDHVAALRAELVLAGCRGDVDRSAEIHAELSACGVRPELDVAALLPPVRGPAELEIVTLGRFAVSRSGSQIPLAEWQSRKARDLLKLLAARRGRPVTREAAAESLWPGEAPGPLANRLSVALSTLRRVLDPERRHPPDHLIAGDGNSLALRVEHVALDVVTFLQAADDGLAGAAPAAEHALREAAALYTGDFLEDDLYEDWSVECREQARSAAQDVSRMLARAAVQRGADEEAARHLRRLLERDPYDADAWAALIGTQLRLRRYGEARRQHVLYARRMAELEIPPIPLARTLHARP